MTWRVVVKRVQDGVHYLPMCNAGTRLYVSVCYSVVDEHPALIFEAAHDFWVLSQDQYRYSAIAVK